MKRSVFRIVSVLTALFLLTGATSVFTLPIVVAVEPELTNYAPSATVSSESNWEDGQFWLLSAINDGDRMADFDNVRTLGWRSGYAVDPVNITLDMDLGKVVSVQKIILYPRGNGGICFPDDYKVEVSADGNTWTKVVNVTGDTEVKVEARTFTFTAVDAQYVRLTVTKVAVEGDNGAPVCEISEMEVYGTEKTEEPTILTNLSLHCDVSATSFWNDPEGFWNASFLTDGDCMADFDWVRKLGWRSEEFSSRDVDIGVTVDLGKIRPICRVAVYPRGNGGICFPDDYKVEISEDGLSWTTVVDIVGDTAVKTEGRVFDITESDARYVRMAITKLSEETDGSSKVCELSEIEVYGSEKMCMTINKNALWLSAGDSETILPSLNTPEEAYDFEYTSADPAVATVAADGTITAVSDGETVITVTEKNSGTAGTCRVVVGDKSYHNILITVPMWGNTDAITEEQFRWLREADINAVMAVGNNSIALQERMFDIADTLWDPEREWNLGVFVHSMLYGINENATDDEIVAHVNAFKNRLGMVGFHIKDEPFDAVPFARVERLVKQNSPSSIGDINFLPGAMYGSYEEDFYGRLSDYAKLTGGYGSYLSFDNYCFGLEEGSVDEGSLFGNLEAVRKAGLNNDISTAFYLQAVGLDFGGGVGYRRPDEGVLRYYIAASLSYGIKWIKYYSWYVPGATGTTEPDDYTDAIMDHGAQKTELYDIAARLNKEVHNVGDILADLDAVEVYHTGSGSNNGAYQKLPSDFFVQPVGDAFAIVSLMKDEATGKSYLMIVNKDFQNAQTMSFALSDVAALTELDKTTEGGKKAVTLEGGVLTRTFAPGEFALYELPDGDFGTLSEPQEDDDLLRTAKVNTDESVSSNGWYIECINDGIIHSVDKSMGWKVSADGVADHTITFDLGSKKEANRLDLYPAGIGTSVGSLFPSAFTLYASDDGALWQEVLRRENIERPTTDVPTYTFEKTSARYYKLVFTAYGDMAIAEAALYNDDGSIPSPGKTSYCELTVDEDENVARGKSVKASSSYVDGAWAPAHVTDGVKMTSWPTAQTLGWSSEFLRDRTPSKPILLTVDLENVYPVKKVVLYPRGNGGICFPSDYMVQLSENGVDWKTVYTAVGDEGKGETPRTVEFETTGARLVRVNMTKAGPELDSGYACQISEIEIYCESVLSPAPETEVPTTEPETEVPETAPKTGEKVSGLPMFFAIFGSMIAVCFGKRCKKRKI